MVEHGDRATRREDWARAAWFYERALSLRPAMPPILVQYGHALKEQGFAYRAAAAYRRAAGLSEGVADPWTHLGHAELVLGRSAEGVAAFRRALTIDPRAQYARDGLDHALDLARGAPSPETEGLALLLAAHELPPSILGLLDVPFYRGHEPGLAGADRRALVDHFGRVGLDRLLPLNALDGFDPAFYRRAYPAIGRLSAADAYRQWLTLGLRRGWAPNAEADKVRAATDGDDTSHSADPSLWTGRAVAAHAARLEAARDWHGALAILANGVRKDPGDADLAQRLHAVADRAIHAAWAEAERRAADGTSLDEARDGLAAILRAVIAALPTQPALPTRLITAVAIVGNADLPQCRFYRIDQKLEQLADAGYAASFFDERSEVPRFLAAILRFQAVIFYRVPAHLHVIKAILAARTLGLATLYEIDDLLFDAAHYPAPIESYGGTLTPAEHRGLALAVPMYAEAMALCAYGLASTEALAARMRPLVQTSEVFVHANGLGRAHAAFAALAPVERAAGRVTILYGSHTRAHRADMRVLVEPALAAVAKRYGGAVSILLVGPVPLSPVLQMVGAQVTILDPMPLEAYWSLLASADIVVAPLVRSPATDGKSAIKWLEAAMLGLPAIVSRTETTERVIVDGVTGFLCDKPDEWTAALARLVADPALRRAVGARAREEALQRYGPKQGADSLRAIFTTLAPPATPRKARVAIVNVFYPPQHFGGATRVVHDNVGDLRARYAADLEIDVFATLAVGGEPYRVRTAAHDGIRVTTATAPADDSADMRPHDEAMGRAFEAFLDAAAPDLVHFHSVQRLTASVVEAARRRGIPYLITIHDGWWIAPHQFLLDDRLEQATYDYGDPLATLRRHGRAAFDRQQALAPALLGAKKVLAVSDAFAAILAASHVPNVVTLANGVSAFVPPVRATNSEDIVRLGYLGGLYPHKGWPLIEQVLRDWPGAPLSLLVVDHALAPGQTRRERWGNVDALFRGKSPPEAMGALYAQIDVLIAPSLWPESFGLVTREALRCGCWVVASDRGAIAGDVVDGVNGFVIDVSGPEGLADVLKGIAADTTRFGRPPPPVPLRTAADQADDLARLYRSILLLA